MSCCYLSSRLFYLGSQFFIELLLSVEQNINLNLAFQPAFSPEFKLLELHFAMIRKLFSWGKNINLAIQLIVFFFFLSQISEVNSSSNKLRSDYV